MPRPLAALLLAVLALGLGWILVTPANQAPDEFAHIGYVQHFAETGSLPGKTATAPPISSEELDALDASNGLRAPGIVQVDLTWSARAFGAWRAADERAGDAARTDGGGPNPASSNPPLYYLTATPAYLAASGGDFFTRVTAVRLVSLLWLLGAVVGAWLLAGELLTRDRLLQTTVAGVVGLAPMTQFISASVNPDPALFATWAFVLWLGVRLLRRGLTPGRAGALFLALGLALVVKATSYALVPAVFVALGVAAWRAWRGRSAEAGAGRTVLPALATAAAALLVTFGVWVVVSRLTGTATSAQAAEVGGTPISIPKLVSYVWQFYLPMLPFMDPVQGAPPLPVYDVFFKGAWGTFGWLEVNFPGWVYVVLLLLCLAVAALALGGLWRDRRRFDPAVVAFVVLVVVGLLAGLHVTEFGKGGKGFIQGRYLLPLAPIAGLALARALRWLPRRAAGPVAGAALGGLLVLNVFAMAMVLERFYA